MPMRAQMMPENVLRAVRKDARPALLRCAMLVERRAKQLLRQGGGASHTPSAAGQPPHRQHGQLGASVKAALMGNGQSSVCGPTEKYGKVHEWGTVGRGGRLPDIKPRTAGALTVPVSPKAYGKRARDMDLILIRRPGKPPLLVKRSIERRGRYGGSAGGLKSKEDIMFVLLKSMALPKRPFMAPALRQVYKQFPSQFRGVVRA